MTIYRRGQLAASTAGAAQIGATWTHIRPSSTMDSTIASHRYQIQYMNDFGASEVWPTQSAYDTNSPTWSNLDPFVQDMVDAGATVPAINLGMCMSWQRRTQPGNNETRMAEADFPEFADMCAQVAARYNGTGGRANVQYYPVWSEMKDFYDAVNNHYDWVLFATFFNQVYDAVKAVRPDAFVGGPYLIIESGGTTAWSHGPSSLTFTGGSMDSRVMDNLTYFHNNCDYDFICMDGGVGHNQGSNGLLPADPAVQIEKFWVMLEWIRDNITATKPLWWIETYINEARESPWSYTQAQREDLWIAMMTGIQQNVSNPSNVVMFHWFHPDFRPQIVNINGAELDGPFSWANTTNTNYKTLVDNWHGA